ncbi:hypothetical protein [Paraburkholderia strydomiana]
MDEAHHLLAGTYREQVLHLIC